MKDINANANNVTKKKDKQKDFYILQKLECVCVCVCWSFFTTLSYIITKKNMWNHRISTHPQIHTYTDFQYIH